MKPGDFMLGVSDIFAVLLPGAIVVYAGMHLPGIAPLLQGLEGAAGWVAFFIASYLMGHFVHLFGSKLDALYDSRNDAKDRKLLDLARGMRTKLLDEVAASVSPALVPPPSDSIQGPIQRSGGSRGRDRRLALWTINALFLWRGHLPVEPPDADERPVNAYQWARTIVRLARPTALGEVERLEADSKFFRSAVVILLLGVLVALVMAVIEAASRLWVESETYIAYAAVLFVLARMSWARFAEQRKKAIQRTYYLALALRASPSSAPMEPIAALNP